MHIHQGHFCPGYHPPSRQVQPDAHLQQQSPIDLVDPIPAQLGDRALDLAWAKAGKISGQWKEDDHGSNLPLKNEEASHFIQLDRKKFALEGLHFHHDGEHTVAGKAYPMELHLVHRNRESGNLAVLGVLVEAANPATARPNQRLEHFLEQVEQAQTGTTVEVDPAAFLPAYPQHYYRYEGSLTTPGYDTNVSWVVMKEPLKVDPKQLEKMKGLFENPARPTQPLNRRFILTTAPASS